MSIICCSSLPSIGTVTDEPFCRQRERKRAANEAKAMDSHHEDSDAAKSNAGEDESQEPSLLDASVDSDGEVVLRKRRPVTIVLLKDSDDGNDEQGEEKSDSSVAASRGIGGSGTHGLGAVEVVEYGTDQDREDAVAKYPGRSVVSVEKFGNGLNGLKHLGRGL